MIPELTTPRLRLRAPVAADFDALFAVLSSPRATYLGGPMDRIAAWNFFARETAGWVLHGFGYWSITDRDSGAYYGSVGFGRHAWFPETEMGWCLTAAAEGRGVGREAAQAALTWGRTQPNITSLVSYIDAPNARSIRLAEALGATRDDTAKRPSPGDLVYRHNLTPARAKDAVT